MALEDIAENKRKYTMATTCCQFKTSHFNDILEHYRPYQKRQGEGTVIKDTD